MLMPCVQRLSEAGTVANLYPVTIGTHVMEWMTVFPNFAIPYNEVFLISSALSFPCKK